LIYLITLIALICSAWLSVMESQAVSFNAHCCAFVDVVANNAEKVKMCYYQRNQRNQINQWSKST